MADGTERHRENGSHEVALSCECGRRLELETSTVRCDCGAAYAVTVTQLAPTEGS